jgi:hypothetical protein
MNASSEHFQEHVLSFLWHQWTALGVAGQTQPVDRWMLDPEALLLATTSLGRDPRLFDEVLDWLNTNGQFINLQRLQNLGQRFGDLTVLRAMAAHLVRRSVHAKWKTLLREKPTVAEAQPLFSGVPVIGLPDELFARHGWLRGPVNLRQMSQAADPHRPTNFLIKLRALFGMQARAEVMAYLLAEASGHPGEMAVRLAYFPRTLQTTLNDLARSGHLQSRREGHEKRFWLRRDDWRFLLTWAAAPGESAPEFPQWVDWATVFIAMESVARFLSRPDLEHASPAVQAIELRACLDTLDPGFLRERIHVPPAATGAAYVESVLGDLHRLLERATGSPPPL